jgi:predicted RND superfamily exporter protein
VIRRFARWFGGAGVRRPWRSLALAGLLLAVCAPGLLRIRLSADLSDLIARSSEASEGLALALEAFASSDAIYALIELDEPDPVLLGELGESLVEVWEQHPGVLQARSKPAEGLPATDPRILFGLADGATDAALRARLSEDGVRRRAGQLKELLLGPTGREIRDLLLGDPLGLLPLLGEHVGRGVPRLDSAGGGFVAPDGKALLLVVRAEDDARDFHEGFLTELRRSGRQAIAAHPRGGEARLGLTGSWAHALEIMRATKADATLLSVTSIAAVLLLYLGFYRSLNSLGLVFLILPVSGAVTMGFGGWVLGSINPLAVGCIAVMFGLGIDPAVHLISRYREARTTKDVAAAADEALAGVGPAVIWATGTTAAALLGMAIVEPRSLGQMGLLAAVGVSVNALLMLGLLPALWTLLGDRITPDPGIGEAAARSLAGSLYRRWGWYVAAFVVPAVLIIALAPPMRFEASLEGFQPAELEPVATDRRLQEHFAEDRNRLMVIVRGADEQAVLRANDAWADALTGIAGVRSFESLSVLRPADATIAARRGGLQPLIDAAPDRLRAALTEVGFRPEPFAAAIDALPTLPEGGEDPAWMRWFEEKHLARIDGEVRVVTRVQPEGDPAELATALRAAAPAMPDGVTDHVTGMVLVEGEAEAALQSALPRLLVVATGVLLVVLGLVYRRPLVVGLAVAPLALSMVLFLQLQGALGQPISPFVLAAIPLLVGVGVDDLLFVLDRYLEDGRPGRLDDVLAGAGRAILVTTLTTLAGFGVLSLSRFDALAGFGLAVVAALGLAFVTSVIVLPALLARFLPGRDAPRGDR